MVSYDRRRLSLDADEVVLLGDTSATLKQKTILILLACSCSSNLDFFFVLSTCATTACLNVAGTAHVTRENCW